MTRGEHGDESTHPGIPASGYNGRSLQLTFVYPEVLAGQVILLRDSVVFGRADDVDVSTISHPTISRRHASVRTGIGALLCLGDLKSRNGTRVNGLTSALPLPLDVQYVVRMGDALGVVDEVATASTFGDDAALPGASPCMAFARLQLARAAIDPAPLLIIGETGTGKERVAREAHRLSGRKGPFVALNCAELSAQLIESELFGHEKGAFTGATMARTGLFVAANGGTLFLDEIGELSRELQPKLLRVIQEREVRPVGSMRAVPVDARIIAATNRNLVASVSSEEFRRDLYARLSLWEVRLPPIRERRQDVLEWVELLTRQWNHAHRTGAQLRFLPDAAERVLLHDWPDNLRGLNRLVHRLCSRGDERAIGVSTLTAAMTELGDAPVRERMPNNSVSLPARTGRSFSEPPTRAEFLAVYESTGRSVRATSKHYGKDRRQIYRWLESFGISRESQSG